MCGINGLISQQLPKEQSRHIVQKMNQSLQHRGPDFDGIFHHQHITLGHRRLSIIDLSESGNQPFFSFDKKYVIVFNGEIYNYKDLKLELQRSAIGSEAKPYFFQTSTDTEVVLAAYLRWGNACVNHFNGMFAFAIYNTETGNLFLARDRFGVKPLYYHFSETAFIFSSEIRPILQSGLKSFQLNTNVLSEYIQYQTVHCPNTIIKGIKQLPAGHYLEFTQFKALITEYWNPEHYTKQQYDLSYEETCRKTLELLSYSVQRRMVSDVSLGAFLSGGIDSSAVVALMASVTSEKIKTFNISFDESEFSESRYARIIANKYNTQHHEIVLKPEDFLSQLPEALTAMDHPGGDGPNTYIVSKATKHAGITVALSGIGGDELFAGYENFKRLTSLQKKWWLKASPAAALKTGGFILRNTKKSIGSEKISEILNQTQFDIKHIYPLSRSVFSERELKKLVKDLEFQRNIRDLIHHIPVIDNKLLSAVSCMEIKTYLQNVLLRDADQMSMAVSLEVREPFLDYKLAEFVLGVNDAFKFPKTPKSLLVNSLGNLLPSEIVNRPKMGFTLPWKHWLKNELHNFCEHNLKALDEKTLLQAGAAMHLWKRFKANDPLITWSRIWHLVVLNHWIDLNMKHGA
jgi:asparagine synthase (glutamine-hydrolysing)